jgi:hypothetical protein
VSNSKRAATFHPDDGPTDDTDTTVWVPWGPPDDTDDDDDGRGDQ